MDLHPNHAQDEINFLVVEHDTSGWINFSVYFQRSIKGNLISKDSSNRRMDRVWVFDSGGWQFKSFNACFANKVMGGTGIK